MEEIVPYSQDDVARFATSQNCTPEEFKNRWIIQMDESFYVFCEGRYLPPIRKNSLYTSILRDLARAPIQWVNFSYSSTGTVAPKKRKVEELLEEYCTVAREVKSSLTLLDSYYDAKSQTFWEAVARPRDLKPEYNKEIDTWVTILGGRDHEKLKDWLATIRKLEKQTCALVLIGPPNTGKTLLCQGAGRIWTLGDPSTLDGVLANFNDELMDCPLIVADEEIASNFRGEKNSAKLRLLIASNRRKLRRKFLPTSTLEGSIRLIICANNDRVLDFDEEMSPEDLEAVVSRFLCVSTPAEAGEYIKSLGGRAATESWVLGDEIAKYILWLERERKVIPSTRFIVQGSPTRAMELLPTRTRWSGLMCEWLVRNLDPPKIKITPAKYPPLVGNGEYLVNSATIADHWDSYIHTKTANPSIQTIGFALKPLRLGTKRIKGVRYHIINTELLLKWAEEHQVGNIDTMKKNLNAKTLLDYTTDEDDNVRD